MSRGFSRDRFLFGFLALSVCACTESVSVPAEFVRLYGDLRIAEREYGETTPDGRAARIIILERYGYSAKKFDSVAEWIQASPDVWSAFQDSVVAYVDSVATEAKAIAPPARNGNAKGAR